MIRIAAVLLALLTTVAASAQDPLFDPDDFLDPRTTNGRPVFISRIVVGGASNMSGDGFRPLAEHVGYLHLANSFSWRSVQFDYKRTQMKAADGAAAVLRITEVRGAPIDEGIEVLRFETSTSVEQTRKATPKSKDTLHAAWYWPVPAGGGIAVMIRSRVTFATQPIETDLVKVVINYDGNDNDNTPTTTTTTERVSGHERTFALDTDTWFRIAGHNVFGSLAVSETKTTGTLADRKERALTYTNRFPSVSLDKARILIRPTLTVGGITGRDSSGVNLVNPAIEIFRPFAQTGANLHVIWSPQWTANGNDWKVKHQVAVLIDRALFVKVF
jgi:hypothetical protein